MTLYLLLLAGAILTAGYFLRQDAYERGREHGRNEQAARHAHPAGKHRSNVKVVRK